MAREQWYIPSTYGVRMGSASFIRGVEVGLREYLWLFAPSERRKQLACMIEDCDDCGVCGMPLHGMMLRTCVF